jgi:hypothetical protein
VLTDQTEFQQEGRHTRRGMAMSIAGPMDAPDKYLRTQPRNPRRQGRQGMPARLLSGYTAKKRAMIPAAPLCVKTRARRTDADESYCNIWCNHSKVHRMRRTRCRGPEPSVPPALPLLAHCGHCQAVRPSIAARTGLDLSKAKINRASSPSVASLSLSVDINVLAFRFPKTLSWRKPSDPRRCVRGLSRLR